MPDLFTHSLIHIPLPIKFMVEPYFIKCRFRYPQFRYFRKTFYPNVTSLNKIPYQLLLLPALCLLLSFCTGRKTKSLSVETIHLYKTQLDSLRRSIDTLQADNEQDQARFYADYLKAIKIIDLLPDSSELKVNALRSLLFPLYIHGAHQETVRQSEKIIEILNSGKKEFSHFPVGGVYYRMANAHAIMGNIDSTTSIYRRLIFRGKDDHDELHKASMLNNAGMIWKDFGEADSAMAYYRSAADLVKEYPDSARFVLFEGSIHDNIATIYEDRGEFDKSIPIYEKNILRYENTDDLFRWINAGISLMNAELEMRNYPRVKILFEQLSPIMDTLTYPYHHTNDLYMFKVCSRYFREKRDFKRAYTYYVKATRLSDSVKQKINITEDQTAKQLARLRDKQFEHQLQDEMLEREIQEKRARMRLWIVILISFGGVIVFTILYFYYKQRLRLQTEKSKRHNTNRLLAEEKIKIHKQEKRFVDLELEYKKKDLADMAISLSQKQEWARELNQHIQNIESSKGNKRSREFKKLKDNVRNQIYVNKQADLILQNMDELSAKYYEKLRVKFPSLTKTEIKLCSFIRLKLTISQIAHLQHIDSSSVVVGRYRLKKKLGLDTGQNLDEFLQSF